MTTKHSLATKSLSKDPQQKVGTIQLIKRLQVLDPTKKVIHDTGNTPSRSFIRAFLTAIQACLTHQNTRALDINGIDQRLVTWRNFQTAIICVIPTNIPDRSGPVIGTGTTPPTNDDFKLEAQIKHGTETGHMEHHTTVVRGPEAQADTLILTIERIFINRTSHQITINECGLYTIGNALMWPRNHCHIRDLVMPNITVPPQHGVRLEYKIITIV